MAMDCEDCGRTFKNSNRPGTRCLKCVKREEVGQRIHASAEAKKAALDEIEVRPLLMIIMFKNTNVDNRPWGNVAVAVKSSSILRAPIVIRVSRPQVNSCLLSSVRIILLMMDIELLNKGKGRDTSQTQVAEVIEIDSDGGNSSDIQEFKRPNAVLSDSVNKHKTEASTVRLTTKSSTPPKTKEWVKRKKAAHIAGTDPKKYALIMFKCELFLQTATGKRSGTRVPMQCRGFQHSEVS